MTGRDRKFIPEILWIVFYVLASALLILLAGSLDRSGHFLLSVFIGILAVASFWKAIRIAVRR